MCLYVKEENTNLAIAEKDITCYKILNKAVGYLSGKTLYRTPFFMIPVELGERVVAEGRQEFGRKTYPFRKHFTHVANGGFIHTFASMQGIKSFFKNWKEDYSFNLYDCVVVKCYIPKGAQYYKGIFEGTGLASYASTELVYGKETIEMTSQADYMHKCVRVSVRVRE